MQTPTLENTTNKRRRLVSLSAILAVVLLLLGLAAVLVNWVGNVLIPVAVILGVVFVSISLLVWVVNRIPDPPYRDWRQ